MRWRQTDYPVSTYIFDKLPNRRLEKFCERVFKVVQDISLWQISFSVSTSREVETLPVATCTYE